ncbi:hypothetical protein Q2392_25935, partial [Escherichia coli]|nr:hypothetical protein [Escherichia coli]
PSSAARQKCVCSPLVSSGTAVSSFARPDGPPSMPQERRNRLQPVKLASSAALTCGHSWSVML